jgi:hypothetical protein
MEYGKHWKQRLSVTIIICGRVVVVVAAWERSGWQRQDPEEISAHSLG